MAMRFIVNAEDTPLRRRETDLRDRSSFFGVVGLQPMQKGFGVATLGHGFFQPEAHLFSQFLNLGRRGIFLGRFLCVCHCLKTSKVTTARILRGAVRCIAKYTATNIKSNQTFGGVEGALEGCGRSARLSVPTL